MKIKLLTDTAKVPERAHPEDAGLDLFADQDAVIRPGRITVIKTGVAVQIPEGMVGYIKPRSGLSVKKGYAVLAGVVDEGFAGEVGVVLTTHTRKFSVEKGDKIAQLVIQPIEKPELEIVEDFDETSRGEDGWGSTDASG